MFWSFECIRLKCRSLDERSMYIKVLYFFWHVRLKYVFISINVYTCSTFIIIKYLIFLCFYLFPNYKKASFKCMVLPSFF